MPIDRHETATKQNAAPKGRIKSGWIAELFYKSFLLL